MNIREHKRSPMVLAAVAVIQVLSPASPAAVVPFTEDFTANSANWVFDSAGTMPLTWNASGGPDGGSYASTTFNFVSTTPGTDKVLFRALPEIGSSGGAFFGNWIGDGVTEFSAMIRHDADVPVTFFARFADPARFPGAFARLPELIPADTWTLITVPIDPGNPQWETFEGSNFNAVFDNIGVVQIGIGVPAGVGNVDQTITFGLDKVSIVPEPATGLLLAIGALAAARRGPARRVAHP